MSELARASNTEQLVRDVILTGNIGTLKPEHRADFVMALCKHIGVDPLTRPFDLLTLQGKTVIYANKSCTDQLRVKHKVSIEIVSREVVEGVYVVTAKATDGTGRVDSDIGAISVKGLAGEPLAVAMMKAGTKAKRRVTLSICGLGAVSDESEVEGIKAEAADKAMPENSRSSIEDMNAKIKGRKAKAVENTAKPEQDAEPPAPSSEIIDQTPPETLEDWAARTDKIAQESGDWSDPVAYEEMRREAFKLKGATPFTAATPAQRADFEKALKDGSLSKWWSRRKV